MPRFSIIGVDYEKSINRDRFRESLESLSNQTFKDFELIICHDGPKETPYNEEVNFEELELNPVILNTPERMDLWGHPSRKLGMENATGEFFLVFNLDNLLYPNCLEILDNAFNFVEERILIFNITTHHRNNTVLRGIPPVWCNIDAMQLVAHRDIWESVGWWYRNEFTSDGLIYEDMCQKFPWLEVPQVLGEHR